MTLSTYFSRLFFENLCPIIYFLVSIILLIGFYLGLIMFSYLFICFCIWINLSIPKSKTSCFFIFFNDWE